MVLINAYTTVSLALLGLDPQGAQYLKPVLSERERSLLVECNVLFVPYGEKHNVGAQACTGRQISRAAPNLIRGLSEVYYDWTAL